MYTVSMVQSVFLFHFFQLIYYAYCTRQSLEDELFTTDSYVDSTVILTVLYVLIHTAGTLLLFLFLFTPLHFTKKNATDGAVLVFRAVFACVFPRMAARCWCWCGRYLQ